MPPKKKARAGAGGPDNDDVAMDIEASMAPQPGPPAPPATAAAASPLVALHKPKRDVPAGCHEWGAAATTYEGKYTVPIRVDAEGAWYNSYSSIIARPKPEEAICLLPGCFKVIKTAGGGWPNNAKLHVLQYHPYILTIGDCDYFELDYVTRKPKKGGVKGVGIVGEGAALALAAPAPADVDEYASPIAKAAPRPGTLMTMLKTEKKTVAIADVAPPFIAASRSSFTTVLGRPMRKMLDSVAATLGGQIEWCSRTHLTMKTDLYMLEQKDKLIKILKDEVIDVPDAMLSFTFDGGQASNGHSFMAATVHWMTVRAGGVISMRRSILGCSAFRGKHRATHVQTKVVEMATDKGVPMEKVQGATHDGAKNMKLDGFPTIMELDCGSHTAQLVLTDLYGPKNKSGKAADGSKKVKMTPFEEVRDPGHNLAVCMRSSPLKRDLLEAVMMQEKAANPSFVIKGIYLAPGHRWNYDYFEQERIIEVFSYIDKIDVNLISDKASEKIEFMELKTAFKVRRLSAYEIDFRITITPPPLQSPSSTTQNIVPEMKEALPMLKAVSDFSEFVNCGCKSPLLSRMMGEVAILKSAADAALKSHFPRIKKIAQQFVESVAARFDLWGKSDLILASQFLDPYVAYTMPVEDFKKAKDLVMGLIADDIDATADEDDVFAAVGLADIKSAKILELERHLQLMREIKHKALKPPLPPSLSYWCANGELMPKLRRVYMNLGSVVMGSIPSEAVFNQLKLTVGDRRGSMLDARSENLTFSSVLAKLDEEDSSRPSNLGDMTPEELTIFEEKLEEERRGVLSAKYVDLVEDEFDSSSPPLSEAAPGIGE